MVVAGLFTLGLFGDPSAYAAGPKVTLEAARKIALAKVPGTVLHEKLKHKKKHDVYAIEIKPTNPKSGSTVAKKVEVDATSGAVLKVKDVKANDE